MKFTAVQPFPYQIMLHKRRNKHSGVNGCSNGAVSPCWVCHMRQVTQDCQQDTLRLVKELKSRDKEHLYKHH